MKIDIHNIEDKYNTTVKLLKTRKDVSDKNKELILNFLTALEIGKVGKRHKKTSLAKNLFSLIVCARHIKVDFDSLGMDDKDNKIIEKFVVDLDTNKIKKNNGKPYSEKTKSDIKKILKTFYKWHYGENKTVPKLVDWIDTKVDLKEINCLNREEIELWTSKLSNLKHKALVMALFDSGARIEEFLNILMRHVTYDKEEGSYKVRIEFSKTKPRTIYLPIATPFIRDYLKTYEDKDNPNKQLFSYKYDYIRRFLKESSLKYIKKHATPHLMRHSSATFYCQKLNPFQLCYRYGWSMSSAMPQRYIDSNGLTDKQSVKEINIEKDEQHAKENQKLKEDISIINQKNRDMESQLNNISKKMAYIEKFEKVMGKNT